MKYINNGILRHGAKIGTATVISDRIEKKGYAVPNIDMVPSYLTMHNVGVDDVKGENWYDALRNANKNGWRTASWHITVDYNKIYQSVNLFKVAWHAGDGKYGKGNRNSIGVEHVQYSKDQEKQKMVWENSIELSKILMSELGIPVNNVVQHYYWTKKDCPYLLRHNRFGYNWKWYKNQIAKSNTQYVRILEDINMRSRPDFNNDSIIGVVSKGGVYTISEKIERTGTDMYKLKSGVYITASTKYVEVFEK